MREYVKAKRIYDTAMQHGSAAELPDSPLVALARTFDFDLAAQHLAAREATA